MYFAMLNNDSIAVHAVVECYAVVVQHCGYNITAPHRMPIWYTYMHISMLCCLSGNSDIPAQVWAVAFLKIQTAHPYS